MNQGPISFDLLLSSAEQLALAYIFQNSTSESLSVKNRPGVQHQLWRRHMKHQYFFFEEGRPKMERLSKMMGAGGVKCHTLATNVITQSRSTHLIVEVGLPSLPLSLLEDW